MKAIDSKLRHGSIIGVIAICAWTLASSESPQTVPSAPPEEQALEEARKVANELGDKVRGLLMKELEKGGYADAVRVCSETAQDIPREFSDRTGHSIRRVSLGYRNSNDIPDDYERRKLEEFDRLNRENKLQSDYYEVVAEDGVRRLRYMKPLIAAPMCITCHGEKENIPPDVKAILAEKYPGDRATGYQKGDVRGAISVKIALPSGESRSKED